MKYTLNIEWDFNINIFRLNKQEKWAVCSNSALLSSVDYASTDPNEIIKKQIKDINVTIDGEEFEIEPELGSELGNKKQLHYVVYGFRQVYPSPPDENQLLNLLLNGNDSVKNILVLKTDGLFYLLSQTQISDNVKDPDYVVRCNAFMPNRGFVGPTIDDDEIRKYVQNLFKTAIYHWLKHLKDKELDDLMEIEFESTDQIPEIVELFEELRQINLNWIPDY